MKALINEIVFDSIKILENSSSRNLEIKEIIISETFFDKDYCTNFKVYKCEKLKETIESIKKINNPVLYWFSFDDARVSKEEILSKFISYKSLYGNDYKNSDYRYTSAIKTKNINVKNTLYVGKVEKGFSQRIKTHLGYATSRFTAGMQLYYWYDIKNFGSLTLNYIEFNSEMKYLITILEKMLAKKLNPLIGKY